MVIIPMQMKLLFILNNKYSRLANKMYSDNLLKVFYITGINKNLLIKPPRSDFLFKLKISCFCRGIKKTYHQNGFAKNIRMIILI